METQYDASYRSAVSVSRESRLLHPSFGGKIVETIEEHFHDVAMPIDHVERGR